MMEVAFSTSVTGLATAIAGLCNGLRGLSVVDIHQNARGECTHKGVCITAGFAVMGGSCEQRRGNGVCRGAKCVIGEGAD
jgi:hypothetical protein